MSSDDDTALSSAGNSNVVHIESGEVNTKDDTALSSASNSNVVHIESGEVNTSDDTALSSAGNINVVHIESGEVNTSDDTALSSAGNSNVVHIESREVNTSDDTALSSAVNSNFVHIESGDVNIIDERKTEVCCYCCCAKTCCCCAAATKVKLWYRAKSRMFKLAKNILGLFLYLLNVITDIYAAYQFIIEDHLYWASLTVLFTVLPMLATTIVSFIGNAIGKCIKGKKVSGYDLLCGYGSNTHGSVTDVCRAGDGCLCYLVYCC
ncbi:unnamed protein product [Meganyctiphanes norvegica]|uniref:XK-related protein n=1 Tax=Meganyctiphanes norvegica TaxID=48144 RepID=A0AAV2PHU0_MEGNR